MTGNLTIRVQRDKFRDVIQQIEDEWGVQPTDDVVLAALQGRTSIEPPALDELMDGSEWEIENARHETCEERA